MRLPYQEEPGSTNPYTRGADHPCLPASILRTKPDEEKHEMFRKECAVLASPYKDKEVGVYAMASMW